LISANILQGTVTALLFGIILGLSNGIEFSLGSVAWASYFGRKNLGSIFGFASAMGVVGAAFGPLPFGIVYDISGTYQPVLIVAAGFCVLLSLLALTVKKPKKAEENLK
jgi:nitrate/nitrite transporter NarK